MSGSTSGHDATGMHGILMNRSDTSIIGHHNNGSANDAGVWGVAVNDLGVFWKQCKMVGSRGGGKYLQRRGVAHSNYHACSAHYNHSHAPSSGPASAVRRPASGVWCLVFGVWCLVSSSSPFHPPPLHPDRTSLTILLGVLPFGLVSGRRLFAWCLALVGLATRGGLWLLTIVAVCWCIIPMVWFMAPCWCGTLKR